MIRRLIAALFRVKDPEVYVSQDRIRQEQRRLDWITDDDPDYRAAVVRRIRAGVPPTRKLAPVVSISRAYSRAVGEHWR